jgi:hypothetical protein
VTAISGLVLLAADARAKLSTPVFYVKLLLIAAAIVVVQRIRRRIESADNGDNAMLPADARFLAMASARLVDGGHHGGPSHGLSRPAGWRVAYRTMDLAHLHLLLNHFPTVGTIVGWPFCCCRCCGANPAFAHRRRGAVHGGAAHPAHLLERDGRSERGERGWTTNALPPHRGAPQHGADCVRS